MVWSPIENLGTDLMHPSDHPRVALVTGANSGIGQSCSQALAKQGYRVILAGRRIEQLNDAVGELNGDPHATELDLSAPKSIDTLLARLPTHWCAIDVLINSAGHDRGGRRKFHEIDTRDFRDVIETNLLGLIHLTQVVIRGMVARVHGRFVNIGSVQGVSTYPRTSVYSASKHGVHGFSECLRQDYADTDIRVTEVLPGLVRSEFASNRWVDDERAAQLYVKFSSVLSPQDIAAAVIYALAQPPHVNVAQLTVQPGGKG
jgi:3-hydroxy acid dehydrogenase/malonic semialdehyde reductase